MVTRLAWDQAHAGPIPAAPTNLMGTEETLVCPPGFKPGGPGKPGRWVRFPSAPAMPPWTNWMVISFLKRPMPVRVGPGVPTFVPVG